MAAVALLALAAGCATDADEKTARHIIGPMFFSCNDGTLLTVRFDTDDHTARIIGAQRFPVVLHQARSGSGYWYADARYSLRGKGRDAIWQESGRPAAECRTRGDSRVPGDEPAPAPAP